MFQTKTSRGRHNDESRELAFGFNTHIDFFMSVKILIYKFIFGIHSNPVNRHDVELLFRQFMCLGVRSYKIFFYLYGI